MRRSPRPGPERIRRPPPSIPYRVASGRGASEQRGAGPGAVATPPRFWVAIVVVGIAAGVLGIGLVAVLATAQHLGFGDPAGSLAAGTEAATPWRRVVSLLVAGVVGGVGWYLLRRLTTGQRAEADDAIWTGEPLSWQRSLGTSVLSEIVIGLGASLGREAAPQLMGAVSGSVLARLTRLDEGQRRLLVACGAGAGLAAVYGVPMAGALFTAEVLLGAITLPVVLPALACSGVATSVAWLGLPATAAYAGVPDPALTPAAVGFAVVAGPPIGLAAVGTVRLMAFVSHHRAEGRLVLVAPLAAFGTLGVVGIWLPQLFGNGKGIALDAFGGQLGAPLLLALVVLKPAMTALCLGSGATGGLLTPALSTGAALGALLGTLWSLAWPGTPLGVFALLGAAAMLGAAMQAPLTGVVLLLELTHVGLALTVPLLVITLLATAVARRVDGCSIYSARLPARPGSSGSHGTVEPCAS